MTPPSPPLEKSAQLIKIVCTINLEEELEGSISPLVTPLFKRVLACCHLGMSLKHREGPDLEGGKRAGRGAWIFPPRGLVIFLFFLEYTDHANREKKSEKLAR